MTIIVNMDETEINYKGFDMSGYGKDDNRTQEGRLENKIKNFELVKELYPIEFKDLSFDKFKLYFWKGVGWWGDDWRNPKQEFSGWETDAIIKWLLENKQLWVTDVPRIITYSQRFEVLKRQSWKCNMCSCKLKYSKKHNFDGEVAHIDHIHPYSERLSYINGIHNINETLNLQALCPECNLKKSKRKIQ